MRKIVVFTATRAEYGLLKNVMCGLCESKETQLQLLISGTHLSPEYGMTINEIEADGFYSYETVEMLLSSDTPTGVCKSMGLAVSGYGESLSRMKPDLIVVLGDRYEAFCLAAAAQVQSIPLAHIHGGEATEGLLDEAFRHSITKMSHIHFTSCEQYRKRVIQLGESPEKVFNVGALGVENALHSPFMSRDELGGSIGFDLSDPYIIVTFHPVTLEPGTAFSQCEALIAALQCFTQYKILFTKSNADSEAHIINKIIDRAVAEVPHQWKAVSSLGIKRYLSAVKHSVVVVGNSSSGIIEVPSFGVPTVNIGDRQKGRIRSESVIDCEPTSEDIIKTIRKVTDKNFAENIKHVKNPYAKPGTAKEIINKLLNVKLENIMKKTFWDIN